MSTNASKKFLNQVDNAIMESTKTLNRAADVKDFEQKTWGQLKILVADYIKTHSDLKGKEKIRATMEEAIKRIDVEYVELSKKIVNSDIRQDDPQIARSAAKIDLMVNAASMMVEASGLSDKEIDSYIDKLTNKKRETKDIANLDRRAAENKYDENKSDIEHEKKLAKSLKNLDKLANGGATKPESRGKLGEKARLERERAAEIERLKNEILSTKIERRDEINVLKKSLEQSEMSPEKLSEERSNISGSQSYDMLTGKIDEYIKSYRKIDNINYIDTTKWRDESKDLKNPDLDKLLSEIEKSNKTRAWKEKFLHWDKIKADILGDKHRFEKNEEQTWMKDEYNIQKEFLRSEQNKSSRNFDLELSIIEKLISVAKKLAPHDQKLYGAEIETFTAEKTALTSYLNIQDKIVSIDASLKETVTKLSNINFSNPAEIPSILNGILSSNETLDKEIENSIFLVEKYKNMPTSYIHMQEDASNNHKYIQYINDLTDLQNKHRAFSSTFKTSSEKIIPLAIKSLVDASLPLLNQKAFAYQETLADINNTAPSLSGEKIVAMQEKLQSTLGSDLHREINKFNNTLGQYTRLAETIGLTKHVGIDMAGLIPEEAHILLEILADRKNDLSFLEKKNLELATDKLAQGAFIPQASLDRMRISLADIKEATIKYRQDNILNSHAKLQAEAVHAVGADRINRHQNLANSLAERIVQTTNIMNYADREGNREEAHKWQAILSSEKNELSKLNDQIKQFKLEDFSHTKETFQSLQMELGKTNNQLATATMQDNYQAILDSTIAAQQYVSELSATARKLAGYYKELANDTLEEAKHLTLAAEYQVNAERLNADIAKKMQSTNQHLREAGQRHAQRFATIDLRKAAATILEERIQKPGTALNEAYKKDEKLLTSYLSALPFNTAEKQEILRAFKLKQVSKLTVYKEKIENIAVMENISDILKKKDDSEISAIQEKSFEKIRKMGLPAIDPRHITDHSSKEEVKNIHKLEKNIERSLQALNEYASKPHMADMHKHGNWAKVAAELARLTTAVNEHYSGIANSSKDINAAAKKIKKYASIRQHAMNLNTEFTIQPLSRLLEHLKVAAKHVQLGDRLAIKEHLDNHVLPHVTTMRINPHLAGLANSLTNRLHNLWSEHNMGHISINETVNTINNLALDVEGKWYQFSEKRKPLAAAHLTEAESEQVRFSHDEKESHRSQYKAFEILLKKYHQNSTISTPEKMVDEAAKAIIAVEKIKAYYERLKFIEPKHAEKQLAKYDTILKNLGGEHNKLVTAKDSYLHDLAVNMIDKLNILNEAPKVEMNGKGSESHKAYEEAKQSARAALNQLSKTLHYGKNSVMLTSINQAIDAGWRGAAQLKTAIDQIATDERKLLSASTELSSTAATLKPNTTNKQGKFRPAFDAIDEALADAPAVKEGEAEVDSNYKFEKDAKLLSSKKWVDDALTLTKDNVKSWEANVAKELGSIHPADKDTALWVRDAAERIQNYYQKLVQNSHGIWNRSSKLHGEKKVKHYTEMVKNIDNMLTHNRELSNKVAEDIKLAELGHLPMSYDRASKIVEVVKGYDFDAKDSARATNFLDLTDKALKFFEDAIKSATLNGEFDQADICIDFLENLNDDKKKIESKYQQFVSEQNLSESFEAPATPVSAASTTVTRSSSFSLSSAGNIEVDLTHADANNLAPVHSIPDETWKLIEQAVEKIKEIVPVLNDGDVTLKIVTDATQHYLNHEIVYSQHLLNSIKDSLYPRLGRLSLDVAGGIASEKYSENIIDLDNRLRNDKTNITDLLQIKKELDQLNSNIKASNSTAGIAQFLSNKAKLEMNAAPSIPTKPALPRTLSSEKKQQFMLFAKKPEGRGPVSHDETMRHENKEDKSFKK